MWSTDEMRYHLTKLQAQQRVVQMILPEEADARAPLLAWGSKKRFATGP